MKLPLDDQRIKRIPAISQPSDHEKKTEIPGMCLDAVHFRSNSKEHERTYGITFPGTRSDNTDRNIRMAALLFTGFRSLHPGGLALILVLWLLPVRVIASPGTEADEGIVQISVAFAECSGFYKAMSMASRNRQTAEHINRIGADIGVTATMIASLSMEWEQAMRLTRHVAGQSLSRWNSMIHTRNPAVLEHYLACESLGALQGDLSIGE